MESNRKTVMVTDGDIRKTLAVVRGLAKAYKTIIIHHNKLPVAGLSRFCDKKVQLSYGEDYESALIEVIKSENPDFLVCTQEETLIRLNEIRSVLESTGVKLTFPPKEVLNRALDKSITLSYAKKIGIPCPKTIVCENHGQLEQIEEVLGYPIVAKPKRSIFLKDGRIIKTAGPAYASNQKELEEIINESDLTVGDFLFQEYIEGSGIGGFFLSNQESMVTMSFAHKRLLDVNPTGSGSCLRESADLNENVSEFSEKLLKSIDWTGVSMVEFRMGIDGTCYLMEVNGRFWGSLALAVECGANFPLELIRNTDGKMPGKSNDKKKPLRVIWELGMVLRFLRILRGKPKGYPGKYPSRIKGFKELVQLFSFKNRYEVFKWGDPKPFLGELASGFSKV